MGANPDAQDPYIFRNQQAAVNDKTFHQGGGGGGNAASILPGGDDPSALLSPFFPKEEDPLSPGDEIIYLNRTNLNAGAGARGYTPSPDHPSMDQYYKMDVQPGTIVGVEAGESGAAAADGAPDS